MAVSLGAAEQLGWAGRQEHVFHSLQHWESEAQADTPHPPSSRSFPSGSHSKSTVAAPGDPAAALGPEPITLRSDLFL